jgi:hypothetical protein
LAVIKDESPDFIVTSPGRVFGLEVTKATRQEFEADLTRLHRCQSTKSYPSDPAEGVMDLSVSGWADDAVEKECEGYYLGSIREKANDLDSYAVVQCDLLIYDNTPTAAPDLSKVAASIRLQLSASPLQSANGGSFGVESVIRDPCLIYDIAGASRRLRYKPEWDTP